METAVKVNNYEEFLNEEFRKSNRVVVGDNDGQNTSEDHNGNILKLGDFVTFSDLNYVLKSKTFQISSIDSNGNIRVLLPNWLVGNSCEKINEKI